MIRLLRVELSRLLHRRAVLLLVAASIVIPVVIGVATVIDTRPPSAAAVAEAERQVELERNSPGLEEQIRACVERPEEWGYQDLQPDEAEAQCRKDMEPQLEWYLWARKLDLAEERDFGSASAITLILAIAMLLAGTTFTGHDWASGSVSNQLLFEPRRLRIWCAKAIVVTGAALALSALVFTSYWLALGAVARSRGLLRPVLLLDCLQMGWRAAAVAAGVALVGFALTMLFRSTVATLGILLAVALAGGTLLGILGFEGPWNPAYNVVAVVNDGTTYYVETDCKPVDGGNGEFGDVCGEERPLSLARGATYLGTIGAVVCGASVLAFRRRDVP